VATVPHVKLIRCRITTAERERMPMDLLRRDATALGLELTPSQLARFDVYARELADWNRRVNLTAIEAPEEIEVKHFLDSLTIAPVLREHGLDSGRLVDVGSGAGFPGLPLQIALPGLRVALIEATGKKARFLKHIVSTLGLAGVDVLNDRAEGLAHDPSLRERFDAAAARAVAEMDALLELTLPFCRQGGLLVAQKKGDVAAELARSQRALETLGGRLLGVRQASVEAPADGRVLVLIEKVAPTPDKYPRRPGMPQKRPL